MTVYFVCAKDYAGRATSKRGNGMLKIYGLVMAAASCLLAGCAGGDRYKLPPLPETRLLSAAHGTVYSNTVLQKADQPTTFCITSAGYCKLAEPVETGLSCTCDTDNPRSSFGGKTGALPKSPD